MKRIIALITVILLAVSVTGCKSTPENSDPADGITSSVAPGTKTDTDKTADISAAPTDAPVAEPTDPPADDTPTLGPDAGDFAGAAESYYSSVSTELINIIMDIIPVDDTTAIFEFKYYNAVDNVDIPIEIDCAFPFSLVNRATYIYSGTDAAGNEESITAVINTDGQITLTSDMDYMAEMTGTYFPSDGRGYLIGEAVLEYLRHIPAANIGDFDPDNPDDVFEDYLVNDWFHQIELFRADRLIDRFLVADDLSAICRVENDSYKLIAGSFENLVNYSDTFDIYNEDEDTSTTVSYEMVYAYIESGPELREGMVSPVAVEAPIDMTESLTLSSSDTDILDIDGTNVIAKAPGEAVLSATFVFGGITKTSEINVIVTADDPDNEVITGYFTNEKYTTYYDRVSQRAVLEICYEDDIYGVDILWGEGADQTHHWSYIGTMDDNGNFTLTGSYFIEITNADDTLTDNLIFENMGATLTLGDDGCYYWHDEYEDAGKDCIFELPE